MDNLTYKQVNPPNPTGKGGFRDNPQNRADGFWDSKMTFSFQYKRFLKMPVEEFRDWDKNTPDSDKTVVEAIAWGAVFKARNDLNERKEVAERTEGKPTQKVDMTVEDLSGKLDELEKTDYDKLGQEATRQMVEAYPPIQNQE